jgi:hypothetical protein
MIFEQMGRYLDEAGKAAIDITKSTTSWLKESIENTATTSGHLTPVAKAAIKHEATKDAIRTILGKLYPDTELMGLIGPDYSISALKSDLRALIND